MPDNSQLPVFSARPPVAAIKVVNQDHETRRSAGQQGVTYILELLAEQVTKRKLITEITQRCAAGHCQCRTMRDGPI
jgi:hypothetical protein